MKKILQIIAAALQYLPLINLAAKEVEKKLGPGNGATKKQIVVASVLAAAHAGETVPSDRVKTICELTDLVVGRLNAEGVFGAPKVSPVVVPPRAAVVAAK